MRTSVIAAMLAGVVAAVAPAAAQEGSALGQREYMFNCATCHGQEARGDGPMADLLTVEVPDLTGLSAANGGTFPFERVYRTIDGRVDIRAHGSRQMPVWGSAYRAEALTSTNPFVDSGNAEMFVSGRILALISYLSEIQE